MNVDYYIHESSDFKGGTQYLGHPSSRQRHDLEGLIKEMLDMGSGSDESDIRAVLNLEAKAKQRLLERGETWDDGLTSVSISIGGKFDSLSDQFQKGRNELRVKAHVNRHLVDTVEQLGVHKVVAPSNLPEIYNVFDNSSKATDGKLTKGGPFEIEGQNFSKQLAVNFKGGGVNVDSPLIMEVTPHKIRALVPDIAQGNYQMTLFFNGGLEAQLDVTII